MKLVSAEITRTGLILVQDENGEQYHIFMGDALDPKVVRPVTGPISNGEGYVEVALSWTRVMDVLPLQVTILPPALPDPISGLTHEEYTP